MNEGTTSFPEAKSPNINLLLIEGDFETRREIKRFFEMSGYYVTAAAGENEAAEMVIKQTQPDLILFNANLPPPASFVSGYQIHDRPEFINIPMVIISVHDHSMHVIDTPEVDDFAIAYITQISRFDELENLVNCFRGFKK